MKDWIKKNKDAIFISAVGITATAIVAGVTYKVTTDYANTIVKSNMLQMSMIANEAGVLDKIMEHQEKLLKLANV